jgi:hypothetical protein
MRLIAAAGLAGGASTIPFLTLCGNQILGVVADGDAQADKDFDLESKPMFSHPINRPDEKRNELHCPDRDLVTPCTTELTR